MVRSTTRVTFSMMHVTHNSSKIIIPLVLLRPQDAPLGGSNVCGDEILHNDAFVVALFYSFRRVLDHDEYRIGVVVLGHKIRPTTFAP